jgi:hypothetical protein
MRFYLVSKNWGTWLVRATTADAARRFVWVEEAKEYGYESSFLTDAHVELLPTEGATEILGSFS